MATVQTWVEATRRHLLSGHQEMRNALSDSYTAGAGVLEFSHAVDGITNGSRLSVGLNNFYVTAVNEAGQSATVIGGQDGTTDANASAGALVRVNPRFTDFEIFTELQTEMSALSAPGNGLYQIQVVELTADSGLVGYDFDPPAGFLDIYKVIYSNTGTAYWKDWSQLDQYFYRLDRDTSATVFPSGLSLQMVHPLTTGNTIRVLCRTGFTVPTALSDTQASTGLPADAWDIPPLGAAMRLMAPREIKRNFTESQSDTRRAAEVPAGAVANSFRPLAALRAQRISEEAARLTSQRPDRRW